MATHRTIASTETDPLAPIVAALMKALAENPVAIAEGALGAPRVVGKALGSTFLAFQSTSGTSPAQWLNLDRMETIRLDIGADTWPNGSSIQVRFSNDNGASWGAYQSIITNGSGSGTGAAFGAAHINLRTGAYSGFIPFNGAVNSGNGTLTVPANCNAMQVRNSSGASAQLRFMAWCLGGLEA